jgi:hypothetical protein
LMKNVRKWIINLQKIWRGRCETNNYSCSNLKTKIL